MELLTEPGTLTDYHIQRSKAAKEEVEEMSKQPLSLEEKIAQVQRINQQMMRDNSRRTH